MSLSNPHLPKRRNGQSAACEPCRKAKIRCDRALPSCSRCRKRRLPAQCIFLAAPLSGAVASQNQNAHGLRIPEVREPRADSGIWGLEKQRSKDDSESSGFLGITSFSSTIQSNIPIDPDLSGEPPVPMHVNEAEIPDPRAQALGEKILSHFPSQKTSTEFIKWYVKYYCQLGYHKPSIQASVDNFWAAFGDQFQSPWTGARVAQIAAKITSNGLSPLGSCDDAMGWINSFTGRNTRWETLGILYIGFCVCCISSQESELERLTGLTIAKRESMLRDMKECVVGCIELSKHSLNSLVCNLLYKHMMLESVFSGDTALSVWREHSRLAGTAVAFGLHCYQAPPKVTLESEIKKRLSAAIFWSDKELSMFTGRPPALSHRYYTAALPMDISDEALSEGGETLALAISKLDKYGWNTDGKIYDSTICRTMSMYSVVLDEIMELFLGREDQWDLQRVYDLKSRVQTMYANIPPHLVIKSKAALIACANDQEMWGHLCGRLDWLRMNFMLERLLTERGGTSKKDLLAVAREMLDLVVFLWLERDRTTTRKHDYDFMIMCYGMPSIGVLCTALLAQVKHPRTQPADTKLPTSEIVQNLSMMIGFLNWVKPVAGNYKLCRRMSGVIKRILEQVFEAQEGGTQREEAEKDGEGSVVGVMLTPTNEFDTTDWPVEALDDLEWLNSIDWTQGPYGESVYGS